MLHFLAAQEGDNLVLIERDVEREAVLRAAALAAELERRHGRHVAAIDRKRSLPSAARRPHISQRTARLPADMATVCRLVSIDLFTRTAGGHAYSIPESAQWFCGWPSLCTGCPRRTVTLAAAGLAPRISGALTHLEPLLS
jgi:hypothetical protein